MCPGLPYTYRMKVVHMSPSAAGSLKTLSHEIFPLRYNQIRLEAAAVHISPGIMPHPTQHEHGRS